MSIHPSKNKFLIVTALTIPFTAGGGRNAFSFARYLAPRSANVSIFSINPGPKLSGSENIQEVNVIRKRVFQQGRIFRYLSYLLMIPALLRQISRSDIIIIYGKYFALHRLIIIAGRMLGKCIVFRSTLLGEDDMDTLLSGNRFLCWIRKRIYAMISMYFALTPEFSFRFRKHFAQIRIFESSQGVDTNVFRPLSGEIRSEIRKKFNIPVGLPVLLSVGSPIYRKGYLEIFDALKKVPVSFIYLVAGETGVSESPHLKNRIGEINRVIEAGEGMLGSRFRMVGMVQNINELYNIADFFILNSFQEGLPNSLLECLASGTIPVIRHIDGLEDYIIKQGQNAFTFKEISEFERTIIRLLELPVSGYDAENSFSRSVRKRISFDYIYEEFIRHISSIT